MGGYLNCARLSCVTILARSSSIRALSSCHRSTPMDASAGFLSLQLGWRPRRDACRRGDYAKCSVIHSIPQIRHKLSPEGTIPHDMSSSAADLDLCCEDIKVRLVCQWLLHDSSLGRWHCSRLCCVG